MNTNSEVEGNEPISVVIKNDVDAAELGGKLVLTGTGVNEFAQTNELSKDFATCAHAENICGFVECLGDEFSLEPLKTYCANPSEFDVTDSSEPGFTKYKMEVGYLSTLYDTHNFECAGISYNQHTFVKCLKNYDEYKRHYDDIDKTLDCLIEPNNINICLTKSVLHEYRDVVHDCIARFSHIPHKKLRFQHTMSCIYPPVHSSDAGDEETRH